MKKTKKSIVLLLVAAMILSSISVTFADTAPTFTDISTSWAKQNIINVYNKGLMNGITTTLFKPLDKVTNYSALITISRMTNAKEKYDLAALEQKYKASVLDKYKVPSYASKEVAYCLEAGIITANDVSALTATSNVTKQVVSAYIAKAFGVTYDADKPIVFLGYNDSMFIIKENKTYINYLIGLGVLSSTGDAKGNFNPDEQLTRDMFAKMMDVASDKYKELKGGTTTPTTPTTPSTTTPTTPTTTTPTTPTTTTPTTTTPTAKPDYTGKVDQLITEYGVIVFQINGANNTVTKKSLTVANNIKCTIEGVASDYWKVKSGDKASIYLDKEGKIAQLIIESKIKKATGTVESILVTDKLELSVNVPNVGIKKYYITSATSIIKNKTAAKYDTLKAGDTVTLTVSDDIDLVEINADSTITTDSGIIESIIYTRTAAPRITMIGYDGKNKEYFIRKDIDAANILIGTAKSKVFDLRPGMNVKVDLENDEIVKLTTTPTESNDKFSGTIKYVNTSLKIITMTYFDVLQQKETNLQIDVTSSNMMDLATNAVTLTQLKEGDKIIVVGVQNVDKVKASIVILDK